MVIVHINTFSADTQATASKAVLVQAVYQLIDKFIQSVAQCNNK
jgi:hypothetical protein